MPDAHDIQRIDGYDDPRFSREVLLQHGAFLVDGVPCEVEITGADSAIVRADPARRAALIDTFRFYAEHVVRFFDGKGAPVASFSPVTRFAAPLDAIQPSQFFVDADKLAAVAGFIHAPEDIVVPLVPRDGRFVSLDGHTRLALAVARGWDAVTGFVTRGDDWLEVFVREAERRGVRSPRDLSVLPHAEYVEKWDRYCDAVFARSAARPE